MEQKKTAIPWLSEEDWGKVGLSIAGTAQAMGSEAAYLRTLARQIIQSYAEIETVLERLCLRSCPCCTEVCCTRATVWYDFRDLLVIYFSTGALPDRQIYRKDDCTCCKLTSLGCSVNRAFRPFLCTWYICPGQKQILHRLADKQETTLSGVINEIKSARKELEKAYDRFACS
jgi:hypothetical protein